MATYLTIPEVTEAEDLLSVQVNADGKTFAIQTRVATTATALFRIATTGAMIPLVVVATDGGMFALDEVYVVEASTSAGGDDPVAFFSLQAKESRII